MGSIHEKNRGQKSRDTASLKVMDRLLILYCCGRYFVVTEFALKTAGNCFNICVDLLLYHKFLHFCRWIVFFSIFSVNREKIIKGPAVKRKALCFFI